VEFEVVQFCLCSKTNSCEMIPHGSRTLRSHY